MEYTLVSLVSVIFPETSWAEFQSADFANIAAGFLVHVICNKAWEDVKIANTPTKPYHIISERPSFKATNLYNLP